MEVKQITAETLTKLRQRMIDFIRAGHGDRRITKQGFQWMKEVSPQDLQEPGTVLLIAIEDKKIVGLLATADYGRKEAFVLVHKLYRENGIGVALIQELMKRIDKVYGKVALDNIPSLKMCFAMGMVGFKVVTGPTGKHTLCLGLGNWRKDDVN
ncbi:GNAT family N-acetyltransferase [Ammoniphilus sp. YIM 78166]|uniref:GNAT family N-acetyltransferase n=1 Tax=Ammoniphilus sp. YIM 78166 TaxID=1644106 RepID=UPI00106F8226|nr:GNAT family N-acetyltransferase [Ammoniphilus sp. YIM 78166]